MQLLSVQRVQTPTTVSIKHILMSKITNKSLKSLPSYSPTGIVRKKPHKGPKLSYLLGHASLFMILQKQKRHGKYKLAVHIFKSADSANSDGQICVRWDRLVLLSCVMGLFIFIDSFNNF